MKVIIVTGIDTEIGKTYVSGHLLANYALDNLLVASYKPIQTGSSGFSPDLAEHERIVKQVCQQQQRPQASANYAGNSHLASYIYQLAASPHLAAAQEDSYPELSKIVSDFKGILTNRGFSRISYNKFGNPVNNYQALDVLLVELAGGVMSPVNDLATNLELIEVLRQVCQEQQVSCELVLVSNGKLGAISQTLAAVKVLPQLDQLIYNPYLGRQETDEVAAQINENNYQYLLHLQQILKAQRALAEINFSYSTQAVRALGEDTPLRQAFELVNSYHLKDSYPLSSSLLNSSLVDCEISYFTA